MGLRLCLSCGSVATGAGLVAAGRHIGGECADIDLGEQDLSTEERQHLT